MKWEEWTTNEKWVRSNDGWLAGVCQGLAVRFGVEPWIMRAAWLASIVFLGFGVLVYILLALTLPREDQLHSSHQEKFLGVCRKISLRTGFDVGLVRFITAFLAVSSFGATMVGYLVLYFVLPDTVSESAVQDSGRTL